MFKDNGILINILFTFWFDYNWTDAVCVDIKNHIINESSAVRFVPQYAEDACMTCACINGSPQLCLTPMCLPPPPTACYGEPIKIKGVCCAFNCYDQYGRVRIIGLNDTDPARTGGPFSRDGSRSNKELLSIEGGGLIAATITCFLVIALIVFFMYRLKKRRLSTVLESIRLSRRLCRGDQPGGDLQQPSVYSIPTYAEAVEVCDPGPGPDPPPPYTPYKPPPPYQVSSTTALVAAGAGAADSETHSNCNSRPTSLVILHHHQQQHQRHSTHHNDDDSDSSTLCSSPPATPHCRHNSRPMTSSDDNNDDSASQSTCSINTSSDASNQSHELSSSPSLSSINNYNYCSNNNNHHPVGRVMMRTYSICSETGECRMQAAPHNDHTGVGCGTSPQIDHSAPHIEHTGGGMDQSAPHSEHTGGGTSPQMDQSAPHGDTADSEAGYESRPVRNTNVFTLLFDDTMKHTAV